MKKFLTAKNRKRLAVAATLLVLVVLMAFGVPYAVAKYIEATQPINTGISGVSNADMNALITLIMNERYPKGSIYMTTDPTGPDASVPGTWELWGQGMVPVGVDNVTDNGALAKGNWLYDLSGNPLTYVDPAVIDFRSAGLTGGSLTGSGAIKVTATGSIGVTGNIYLKPGGLTLDANSGKVSLSDAVISLKSGTVYSDAVRLGASQLPRHRHETSSITTMLRDLDSGSQSGIKRLAYATNASGTTTWPPGYDSSKPADRSLWGVYDTSTSPAATEDIPSLGFAVDLSNFTAGFSPYPAGTITNPPFNYDDQEIDVAASKLTTSGFITSSVTDETLQPYVTCYMFRRAS